MPQTANAAIKTMASSLPISFFHLNNLFPLYTLFASRPLPLRTFFLYDYVTTKPPRVKPSKTYKKDPALTFS